MKSPRTPFILALLCFVAALVAYVFWYQAVVAASSNAATLANSITAASVANQEGQEARSAQSGLGQSEAAIDHYFLANADVVPFLETLQALGSGAGASVTVTSVGTAPSKAPALAVALHITGSFDQVVSAAGAIEYAPYDLTEQSLVIANDGKDAWHADMSVEVGTRIAASSTPETTAPAAAATTTSSGSSTTTSL